MELVLDVGDEIYELLKRRADKQGFESVESYSEMILNTVIHELEETDDDAVRDRLEDLGYLN